MKKINKNLIIGFIILYSIFYILYSAPMASAQVIGNLDFLKGIVPCGTSYTGNIPCTVCHFYKPLENIINFFLYTAASLATLMATIIAFLFLFSGGSPQKITDAKSKLRLLVWGIIVVLGSWLLINTIINFVVNPQEFHLPWNQISCEVSQPSGGGNPGGGNLGGGGNALPFQPGGGSFGGGGASGELGALTLSEQEARSQLQQAGIDINKNPCPAGVPYQNVSGGCTSLGGLQTSAEKEAIQLKKDCNCTLQITGGTELGHEQGTVSHASGDKLDFKPNSTLDQYIQNNFTYVGLRSDGAKQYRSPNGILMAREGDHWDATFVRL